MAPQHTDHLGAGTAPARPHVDLAELAGAPRPAPPVFLGLERVESIAQAVHSRLDALEGRLGVLTVPGDHLLPDPGRAVQANVGEPPRGASPVSARIGNLGDELERGLGRLDDLLARLEV